MAAGLLKIGYVLHTLELHRSLSTSNTESRLNDWAESGHQLSLWHFFFLEAKRNKFSKNLNAYFSLRFSNLARYL